MTKIKSRKFSNKHVTDPLLLCSQILIDVLTDVNNRKHAVKISIGGVQVCIASTLEIMY